MSVNKIKRLFRQIILAVVPHHTPFGWLSYLLGYGCLVLKMSPRAELLLRDAIGYNQKIARYHDALAIALNRLKRWGQALQALESAAALDSNNAHRTIQLAKAAEKMNQWEEAIKYTQKALSYNRAMVDLNYMLGHLYRKNNQLDDADRAVAVALANDSNSKNKRLGMGAYYESREMWSEAIDAYLGGVEREPGNGEFWFHLGHCYHHYFYWQEAHAAYKKALDFNYDAATCQQQLAIVYKYIRDARVDAATGLFGRPVGPLHDAHKYLAYCNSMPVVTDTVLYECQEGKRFGGVVRRLFVELLERFPTRCNHVLVVSGHHNVPAAFLNAPNVTVVQKHSDAYLKNLACAGYLITDYSFPPYFSRQKKQRLLHCWTQSGVEKINKHNSMFFLRKLNVQRTMLHATHLACICSNPDDTVLTGFGAKTYYPAPNEDIAKEVVASMAIDFFDGASERSLPTSGVKQSILIFGGALVPNGVTTSLQNLLANIDPEKYAVSLAVDSKSLRQYPERMEQLGLVPDHVEIIGCHREMTLTPEQQYVLKWTRNHLTRPSLPMWDLYRKSYQREFERQFSTMQFDAVIDFAGYDVPWVSMFACCASSSAKQKTLFFHNDMYSEWKQRFASLEMTFHLAPQFHNVLSVSKSISALNRQNLSKQFDIPPTRFDFCENLLNPGRLIQLSKEPIPSEDQQKYFSGTGPVFITMGRLSKEKDHQKLLNAFATVLKKKPTARLLILGDGPLKATLAHHIRITQLTGFAFLLGRLFNPFAYVKKADCFVLSSNHEGQPMVLLESMLLAVPIVATNITGARGVIEGRAGQLVENSEAGLVEGMMNFGKTDLSKMSFDSEKYQTNAIEMFYQKAVGSKFSQSSTNEKT